MVVHAHFLFFLFVCVQVALVCEGLDTVAQVSINGKVIGHTDNMFRRYLFTVPKGLLRADQSNTITISFVSAPLYAKVR
jgi:beta-mannosidase